MSEGKVQFKFFVYIVESPSAPDLYHSRSEGARLAETLKLDHITCITRTAINKEAFLAALYVGLPEAMKECEGLHPILHLSLHGSAKGVQLSSGDVIDWNELRELLVPINRSLAEDLILCMSACEGYNACRMAMRDGDEPHPYLVMVGNHGSPTWSDTAVAYLTFYHLLAKGHTINEAVDAMGVSSGDLRWIVETAEEAKQGFLNFLNERSSQDAIQQLETAADQQHIPESAKALESSKGPV